MTTARILSLSAEIFNGLQGTASAVGASDIYTRYYRVIKFCDPRKTDIHNIECNKYVRCVAGYFATSLVITNGILHTMSDLPALRRRPEMAERVNKFFNAWNIFVDLADRHSLISQVIYFLYTQIQLKKFDPTSTEEVTISDAGIALTAIIATILAALCNIQIRKKIFGSLPLSDRAQKALHGILDGINGYCLGRALILVTQGLHDVYHPYDQWTYTIGGFIGRTVFGAGFGIMTGCISRKYTPESTIADIFGQRAERAGIPLNIFQKISSIMTSISLSFILSAILGLTIKNNEPTHKAVQVALLGLMAAYIPLYYILIRCCCRDRYGVLPGGDDDDHDDDNGDEKNNNSREPFHLLSKEDQQKKSFPKIEPHAMEKNKVSLKAATGALNRNVLFNKMKSQDRKAFARRMVRSKNKDIQKKQKTQRALV